MPSAKTFAMCDSRAQLSVFLFDATQYAGDSSDWLVPISESMQAIKNNGLVEAREVKAPLLGSCNSLCEGLRPRTRSDRRSH